MTDTHETDRDLWLEAHDRAPAFTLQPGQTLTPEEREYARDRIAANEARDRREHAEARAGYPTTKESR